MKIDGINVYKSQINQHINKRQQKISYIVIHDTSNYSAGASAAAHVKYFNTTTRKASADFLIDEVGIYQINDYKRYFTWHCGDGKGKYGIRNGNSVGLEICVNKDGNYQASVNNSIILTAYLMQELGISFDNVVRHYDASRKLCPSSMVADKWAKWHRFKQALQDYLKLQKFNRSIDFVPISYKGKSQLIATHLDKGFNYVSLRALCGFLGYKVTYKDGIVYLDD